MNSMDFKTYLKEDTLADKLVEITIKSGDWIGTLEEYVSTIKDRQEAALDDYDDGTPGYEVAVRNVDILDKVLVLLGKLEE